MAAAPAWGTDDLLKLMPPRVDALSPENVIAIFTGPATGAAISEVRAASPSLPNRPSPVELAICKAEVFRRATFKRTGFDGMVITGKAPEPTYLYVSNGRRSCALPGIYGEKLPVKLRKLSRPSWTIRNWKYCRSALLAKKVCASPIFLTCATVPMGAPAWELSWAPKT